MRSMFPWLKVLLLVAIAALAGMAFAQDANQAAVPTPDSGSQMAIPTPDVSKLAIPTPVKGAMERGMQALTGQSAADQSQDAAKAFEPTSATLTQNVASLQDPQLLTLFYDEPDASLQKAHDAFGQGDKMSAAADLKKAAAFLTLQAKHAPADLKQGMNDSARAVDDIAKRLAQAGQVSDAQMRQAFASVDHALSRMHYGEAAAAHSKNAVADAGKHLKMSAIELDRAANWSGQIASRGAGDVWSGIRSITQKSEQGAAWSKDEVDKGMQAVKRGISDLGQQLKQSQQQPAAATPAY